MRVTVVGCSPAWPNPGGAQSGYLVEHERGRLLLDCGPGVLPRLLEQERWPSIDAIVISHLHLDHWGDLVPWALGVRFGTGAEAKPPELWLGPGDRTKLLEHAARLASAEMFEQAFAIREHDGNGTFTAAGFEVTPRLVPHYDIHCWALRVSDGDVALGYSADGGPSDALVETARGAGLFLCEATLNGGEPEPRGHLTLEEALAAYGASGAKRLAVVHRPADLPPAPDRERAHDGLVIDL